MEELTYIQKSDLKVNGQYKFVSHDDVAEKVHPMLVKHRVLALPTTLSTSQEGNRTVIMLRVHFVNVDKPEDQFFIDMPGYGVDPSDKGPGKAISYALKYALLKAFTLETGEDPDKDSKSRHEPPACLEFDLAIPSSFTEAEKKRLNKFLIESAEAQGKHIEEIKASAVGKMEQFLEVFKKWNGNKNHK
jgi:hypothetical protein